MLSLNKTSLYLIYSAIFFALIFPVRSMSLISIGPIAIYFYEIPLLMSLFTGAMVFFANEAPINTSDAKVIRLYFPLVILFFLGLIQGLLFSEHSIATILKDARPILYWGVGILLVLFGHHHLKLQTLFWVMVLGLSMQLFFGVLMVMISPSILIETNFRLPARSISMVTIVLTTYLASEIFALSKREDLLLKLFFSALMIFVILVQNRTTWIGSTIIVTIWLIKKRSYNTLRNIIYAFSGLVLFFSLANMANIISDTQVEKIKARLFVSTLSSEGVKKTWEGNRETIYEGNYNDFIEKPFLGHGFGHQFSFVNENISRMKEQSSVDNSMVNVVVKFGLIGLSIFIYFLVNGYKYIKNALDIIDFRSKLYLYAFYFTFPVLLLMSLNISLFYGYPEVMIFSLFISKSVYYFKSQ